MKLKYHPMFTFGSIRESLIVKQIQKTRVTIQKLFNQKEVGKSNGFEMNLHSNLNSSGILRMKLKQDNFKAIDSRLKFVSLTAIGLERLNQLQPKRTTFEKQKFFIHQTLVYLESILAISESLLLVSNAVGKNKSIQKEKQKEVDELVDEVNRIASMAEFNGMALFLGDFAKSSRTASMWFLTENKNERYQVFIATMTANALGLVNFKNDVLALSNRADFQKKVKHAIHRIQQERKQIQSVLK